MIYVKFKNEKNIVFDADGWSFRDVGHNNVQIINGDTVIAHINWDNVLYISKEEKGGSI